ncbi:MAG: hypothetical protein QXJ17_04420 [Nitrososphaeria archaeon]
MSASYKYAIVHEETGVVVGRFETLEGAEKALKSLPRDVRKAFKVRPVTHPKVQEYYRKVSETKKKHGNMI